MSEKENNHKFLISIIVLILVAIAIYFIVLTYNENKVRNENNIKQAVIMTEDGYRIINSNLKDYEAINIEEINKQDDNTYRLRGTLLSRYTITENEYDYLKNQEPLVVDDINYYFTWSDEHNEYIFVSKKSDNIYFLEKDEETGNYFVNLYGDDSYVYEKTDIKVEVNVNSDVVCLINNEQEVTAKRLFEEEEVTYGVFNFEFKDGKCIKIKCDLR